MDLELLKQQAHQLENQQVEFKKSTGELKEVGKTLCGFLNSGGGNVFIGVTDEGKIIGQTVSDQTKQKIANLINKIEPAANITIEYIKTENDSVVIKLNAKPDANQLPYQYDGRAYERFDSQQHLMSQSRYNQLLLNRTLKTTSWEILPATNYSIDDLDGEQVIGAIKDAIREKRLNARADTNNVTEALQKLDLIQDGFLTNAAVVLFAKTISPAYYQCVLRMARFKGSDKSNIIDSNHVQANAFELLDYCQDFINRHTSIGSNVKPGQLKREERPDYHYKAIREAITNAICHRNYSANNGSIMLSIYDDRLEIISHGTLPNGVRLEQLQQTHPSRPRNPLITQVFFRRGYIEALGTGTEEMIRACKELGAIQPEFLEQNSDFIVRFRPLNFKPTSQLVNLNNRQKKLLSLLADGHEYAPNELLNALEENITDRTLRNDLRELKNKGLIRNKGSGPNTVWFISK